MKNTKDYTETLVRLRSKTDGQWFVHPEMRPRLVEYATAEGISMTEAVVKILSDQYNLPYETTPRKTTPTVDAENLRLRIPTRLYQKLVSRSSSKVTIPDLIRKSLCDHFGLAVSTAAAA